VLLSCFVSILVSCSRTSLT